MLIFCVSCTAHSIINLILFGSGSPFTLRPRLRCAIHRTSKTSCRTPDGKQDALAADSIYFSTPGHSCTSDRNNSLCHVRSPILFFNFLSDSLDSRDKLQKSLYIYQTKWAKTTTSKYARTKQILWLLKKNTFQNRNRRISIRKSETI